MTRRGRFIEESRAGAPAMASVPRHGRHASDEQMSIRIQAVAAVAALPGGLGWARAAFSARCGQPVPAAGLPLANRFIPPSASAA